MRRSLAIGLAPILVVSACQRELTLEDPIEPGDYVEAQFDPTNPIPVLQTVASPTALAENPAGGLTVVPAPCELPSVKQCLGFVAGWPTTTPVTLYFSGDVDLSTVPAGIKWLKLGGPTTPPTAVEFDATIADRPPPPAACKNGQNGSNPERTYTDADLPTGKVVILRPKAPLSPSSTYVVLVESSEAGGLKAQGGARVHPSALFSLLNVGSDQAPVLEDGSIPSALLRGNVQSAVVAALFPGRLYAELSAEEKATADEAITTRARTGLYPLFRYFAAFLEPLVAAGATSRESLVFATLWHTAPPDATSLDFDPGHPTEPKLPLPNVELMTTATVGPGGKLVYQVKLGIKPCTEGMTTGCDSPSAVGLKTGLNTLDGFSLTAPISITATGDLDPASLEGRVLMFELDDAGNPVGAPVPIAVTTSASTAVARATLQIWPGRIEADGSLTTLPLKPNTRYAVGVLRGVKDKKGGNVSAPTTYEMLKSRLPLIVDGAFNPEAKINIGKEVAVETLLQCSTVAATGQLASDEAVNQLGNLLENQLLRARWQVGFEAFEKLNPAVPREGLLMAFTHKTQSTTDTLDLVKGVLMKPDKWEAFAGAMGRAPVTHTGRVIPGSQVANALGLTQNFCVPLCLAGLAPGVMCNDLAAVDASPTCIGVKGIFTGNIGSAHVYELTSYKATRGNPFAGAGVFDPARFQAPRLEPLELMVVLPRGTSTSAAADVPVVIFQHGLGQYKEQVLLAANSFAKEGWATVAIDLPFHGSRAGDLVYNDPVTTPAGTIPAGSPCLAGVTAASTPDPEAVTCTGADCTGGCDGKRDPSATGFLSPNVFAVRDGLRQATIDHLALLRALQTESAAGRPLQALDGSRVGYFGQSMGAITGANFAAYAPELLGAVLNVGGGGLINVLLGSVPAINGPLYAALAQAGVCTPLVPANPAAGCQDTSAFRQFLLFAQTAVDPADPLVTAWAIKEPHNGIPPLTPARVLMQMAIPDLVVPNPTTLDLGYVLGFDPSDEGPTSHFQTFDFTGTPGAANCHGFALAPCSADPTALQTATCYGLGSQRQALRFISSGVIGSRSATDIVFPGLIDCRQVQ